MSRTISLETTNQIINSSLDKFQLLHDPLILIILNLMSLTNGISLKEIQDIFKLKNSNQINFLFNRLLSNRLIERKNNKYFLTSEMISILDHTTFDLSSLANGSLDNKSGIKNTLGHSYEIVKIIGKGSTSTTFLVKNKKTHCRQTLKVFSPNIITYKELDEALKKLSVLDSNNAFPKIMDSGEIYINHNDNEISLPCVLLDFVPETAKTFHQFLAENENISREVIEEFISTIGGALELLESVELNHGDLHEANILVRTGNSPNIIRDIYIIDYIGVPSFLSPNLKIKSDLENFKDHLMNAILEVSRKNPRVPVKTLVGDKVFRILQKLKTNEYNNFKEIMKDYENHNFSIPENYFTPPSEEPFECLRAETIKSDELLFKLFEPINSKLRVISRFGNTWISGPRGCGKSHYLRIMMFYPEVIKLSKTDNELKQKFEEINYSPLDNFGILFPCRLGEFKPFVPESINKTVFDINTKRFLKHLLILKIWNKTLERIKAGLNCINPETSMPIIRHPNEISWLRTFIEERLGPMLMIEKNDILYYFNRITELCLAKESFATSIWHKQDLWKGMTLLNERDLDNFFNVIKNSFQDLKSTRFYILVDDASEGHIHFEMQKVLNSLVISAQSNHCFKITFDKYLYTLETAEGRGIDPRNDVTYEDLGEGTISTIRGSKEVNEYMARVINRRLEYANYKSNIREILGHSQDVTTFLSALSQPGKSTIKKIRNKERAYFAGWNIISSLAHGSMRSLLELIESIFKDNNFKRSTQFISLVDQDKSVRKYSKKQFKALAMLPGVINDEPLGEKLQNVISVIGKISSEYLKNYKTNDSDRWYETISISREDKKSLSQYSSNLLIELIKYGLFIVEGTTFSRSQFGLSQRYDMNKIFAPAFETTYRVRNLLYVNHQNLDLLLKAPDNFLNKHRHKLNSLTNSKRKTIQEELF